MRSRDALQRVRALQIETYRRLSGIEKTDIALEMSEGIRSVMVEGIKARLPDLDESGAHRELIQLLHGDALASAILDQIGPGPPTDPGSDERN